MDSQIQYNSAISTSCIIDEAYTIILLIIYQYVKFQQ